MPQKKPCPDKPYTTESNDLKFEQYKLLLEKLKHTCDERATYNDTYTKLLVVDLLLVVLTPIATLIPAVVNANVVSVNLIRGLLTIILIAGAVISFAWATKLYTYKVLVLGQQTALRRAEAAGLAPFCGVTVELNCINEYLGVKTTGDCADKEAAEASKMKRST